MSSCTLTSKQLKRNLLLSVFLVLLAFILLDSALIMFAKLKTSPHSFIDDKKSKILHFKYNKKKNRDIVFLGSSRTMYHISTHYFKSQGLDVYNFGISGNYLTDYPTIISTALEQRPKNIVLSLPVGDLYSVSTEIKRPQWSDVKFYMELEDKIFFRSAFFHWTKNLHVFLGYSEPILIKIKNSYKKLEPIIDVGKKEKEGKNTYSKIHDCTVFSQQNIGRKGILKCTNGDGILLGNIPHVKEKKIKRLDNLDKNVVRILRKYIKMIKDKGTNPIVVLEPILHNHYRYNKEKIQNIFPDIDIIDFTDARMEETLWVDTGHLNEEGRKVYSQKIFTELKGVLR